MPENKKLFLLDAMALIYRAYFAFSKNPRINSKGMNTSAVLGFTNTLYDVLKNENPTHIGVAFDTMAPTVRHEEFIEYKANREKMPEDLAASIPYVKKLLECFNIPILYVDGYEADDVIGTLAKKAEKEGFETFMMTPDKDFGQLVSENIFIYKPARMLNGSSWNIKKEILWDIWILFTVSVGYFLYYKALGIMEFGFDMIIKLILIAIVPISVLITFNRNRLLQSHLKSANELNKKLKENKSIPDKLVHFVSDYQKDNLSIKVSLILFIRSANNYIEVFWKENQDVKSQMVRCSLTKAEEVLNDDKFIIKCHRSYMANINHIDKIAGSSQGYRLYFEKVDFPVPVSKNYVHKLKELI